MFNFNSSPLREITVRGLLNISRDASSCCLNMLQHDDDLFYIPWIASLWQEQRSLILGSLSVGFLSTLFALSTWLGLAGIQWIRSQLYSVLEVRQHDQMYHWLLDWLAAQRAVSQDGKRVFVELHPEFHKGKKDASLPLVRL